MVPIIFLEWTRAILKGGSGVHKNVKFQRVDHSRSGRGGIQNVKLTSILDLNNSKLSARFDEILSRVPKSYQTLYKHDFRESKNEQEIHEKSLTLKSLKTSV